MSDDRAVPSTEGTPRDWRRSNSVDENMLGPSSCTAKYCGLGDISTDPIVAYPNWSKMVRMGPEIWRRMAAASIIALFLQWGTTGASILIAFLTPTVGLGCRSGSYLIYGTLGTVVWLLLLASMLLSHQVMLLYQDEHLKNPRMDFRSDKGYQRTWTHSILCALAVSLRYLGKLIAFGNALWLMASSLMEFTGGYDNCWCTGNYVGLGKNGWIGKSVEYNTK